MTDVYFYHLQNQPLEKVLPQLLEKCLERGWRCVVQAQSDERVAAYNIAIVDSRILGEIFSTAKGKGMSKIELNGNIGNLIEFYRQEKRLFGKCPECGESFRLSEIKITYGKEPPKDALARMKKQRDALREQLERLEEDIEDVEAERDEEILRVNEKWRDRFDIEVSRRLQRTIREIRRDAVSRARVGQLGKTLEKVAPMFPGFGHHPYDVRPVFDPVDFVVFDGYFQGKVTDITFVEFKTGQSRLTKIQDSIRETVERKRVHFEVKRLSKEAIKALTATTPPKRLQQLLD